MRNRREFIKTVAGATAGALVMGSELVSFAAAQAPAAAPVSRLGKIMVGGKRVKVIDAHAHWNVPGLPSLNPAGAGGGGGARGGAGAAAGGAGGGGRGGAPAGAAAGARGGGGGGGRGGGGDPVATRLAAMDARGIDVQVLSVNGFNWYASDDRDLVSRYVAMQDEGLSAVCKTNPARLVAVTSPSLQFPDLAAQQLERAMKELGLRGAYVQGHCRGESLSAAKYDVFWAKCQELGAMVFMHPQGAENVIKADGLEGEGIRATWAISSGIRWSPRSLLPA